MGTSWHTRISSLFVCLAVLGAPLAINPEYDQPYRPQYHFSPRKHWTNDPNGLIFFEGEYHLFFQHNPFGDKWGHMSWGHAVSRDLLHWQELPLALPEEKGVMIFTGSTVIDEKNSSGFCSSGKPCMVAIYTGHTPETGSHAALQTQNLAYSNDRGRTWTKFKGNPVLDLHMADFRDPKVFWSAQSNRWIMVVSLPNDHKVRFYGSSNLKRWEQLGEFGPAGATGGQWECPELFAAPLDGNAGNLRWVLKIGLNPGALQGGSGEQYFVGHFDGTRFTNDNTSLTTLWTDYGKDCYCALTFNNLPPAKPPLMLGWMNNWQYAANLPTSPWRGQMTLPRTVELETTPDGVRLIQKPPDEIREVRESAVHIENASAAQVNQRLAQSPALGSHSFELESSIALGTAEEAGWRLLGMDRTATLVGYNRSSRKIFVDRTHSGLLDFSKDFPARVEAPLKLAGDVLKLDLFVDRNSLEVFADGGRVTLTNLVFPPARAHTTELYTKGGTLGRASATLWGIRSIYAQ